MKFSRNKSPALFVWGLAIFVYLPACILLSAGTYDTWLQWLIKESGLENQSKTVSTHYFTPYTFSILKIVAWSGLGLLLTGGWLLYTFNYQVIRHCKAVITALKQDFHSIKNLYNSANRLTKILFISTLIVICLLRVLYWHWLPFFYDEIYSWLFFVRKGLFTTLSYYPGPNNHIFSNLLSVFLHKTGLPPVYTMRLPSLPAGLITCLLAGFYFRKKQGWPFAFCAMILVAFHPAIMFYSIQGRGYTLQIFWFLLNLISAERIFKKQDPVYNSVLYGIAGVLGMWTLPTHVYALFSIFITGSGISLSGKSYAFFKKWLLVHILIALGGFLVYLPVFIVTGPEKIMASGWFRTLPLQSWFSHAYAYFQTVLAQLWGFAVTLPVSLILLLIIPALLKWKHKLNSYSLRLYVLLFIPFALLPFQGILPFPRIWTYLCIPLIFLILYGVYMLYTRKIYGQILLFCIALGWLGSFTCEMYHHFYKPGKYQRAKSCYQAMKQEAPAKVLVEDDFYFVINKYLSVRQKKEIKFIPGNFKKNANFDMAILEKTNFNHPSGFSIIYEDTEVILIKRKQ